MTEPSIERRVVVETRQLAKPFRTAQFERTEVQLVVVELRQGGHRGRGESFPHETLGLTADEAAEVARSLPLDPKDGLLEVGPGAAADALEAAWWDLRARQTGRRAWDLLGLQAPTTIRTMRTIGIDEPSVMEEEARCFSDWPVLKIKTGPEAALDRVDAVRRGAPRARLVVDANQSFAVEDLRRLGPALVERGVACLEQPLPAGQDEVLEILPRSIPLCADESLDRPDQIPNLASRYDAVNLKLPRLGGLSAALAARSAARRAGLGVWVGCMVSTSLAIAPALLVAQGADFVDLDGPLHLASDRSPGLRYRGPIIHPADPRVWG